MGIAALVTALLLHAHMHAQPPQHRQHVVVHPVWPAQGTITGAFGHDGSRPHPGIDIGILRSLSVRAAVPGRVVGVGPQVGYEGYGNLVRVRSRGYTELYAHLASWRVHVGERVTPGERIATAGCTGWCTGTHLHFEVRRGSRPVSPLGTVLRPLVAPVKPRVRALASAQPTARELLKPNL